MMVFINPGHAPNGVPDPGAVNEEYGITEAESVAFIGKWVADYLKEAGIEVVLYQNDNLDYGDGNVVDVANASGADLFVSIHANAYVDPAANGAETYCFDYGGEGDSLAHCIQWHIVNSLDVLNRGVKTASYAVLKKTIMPAVLVETCFITNEKDVQLLLDERCRIQMARAISRGITEYLSM